jgi:hypothetical protein
VDVEALSTWSDPDRAGRHMLAQFALSLSLPRSSPTSWIGAKSTLSFRTANDPPDSHAITHLG